MKGGKNELKPLGDLKTMIFNLGRLINAYKSDLPTIGQSSDFAHPYIEVSTDGYQYIVVERGTEIRHETTSDLDELLYWVFEDVSFSMAIRQVKSRNDGDRDQRRAYFAKQVELLEKLKPEWGEATRQKQAKVLEKFPFDDFASSRARYCKQLREMGVSNEEAWQAACKKYPLNP